MARTTFICKCRSVSYAKPIIDKILAEDNYMLVIQNDEQVYKCGNGQLIPMKFIKIEFTDSTTVQISGWVRGNLGPEQNLDGYINGFPKKQVQKTVQRIQAAIL